MGTSSGPAGKDLYHNRVGGPSVVYKTNSQQHSQQSRGPVPTSSHYPQESIGQQPNSPPLRLNICGQVIIIYLFILLCYVFNSIHSYFNNKHLLLLK